MPEAALGHLIDWLIARAQRSPCFLGYADCLLEALYQSSRHERNTGARDPSRPGGLTLGAVLVRRARYGEPIAAVVTSVDKKLTLLAEQPAFPEAVINIDPKPETETPSCGVMLIIALQGTDARRALAYLDDGNPVCFLQLGSQSTHALPEHIKMLDRGRFREFDGYAEHEPVRRVVDNTIDALPALVRHYLPP